MQSDDHLIAEVLAGRRDAYAELVRRYERLVHGVAWSILRDHHAAEDATQETFIRAFSKLPTLSSPRTFGNWLLTIVRHTATDLARAKTPGVPASSLPEPQSPVAQGDEDSAAQLLTALARLPTHEQQVVLFRYFDGLSVAEIASLLGRPVGTVTKQLSRALARLRDRLKETP